MTYFFDNIQVLFIVKDAFDVCEEYPWVLGPSMRTIFVVVEFCLSNLREKWILFLKFLFLRVICAKTVTSNSESGILASFIIVLKQNIFGVHYIFKLAEMLLEF